MTSVKEQVAGMYACALALRGIAAIAIDHRHFGESGGDPRQWENPVSKVRDIVVATQWLRARSSVDSCRVGLVGVCLGASYAAVALGELGDVDAFAVIAGYFPRPELMRAGNPDRFDAEIRSGQVAMADYRSTGMVTTVPAAGVGVGAPMDGFDVVDYYTSCNRGAVSNYRNEFAVQSRATWLPFSPHDYARSVTVPTRIVHSRAALAPMWAEDFFAKTEGPSEFVWLDDVKQTDFYDRPDVVDHVADQITEHLETIWTENGST